MKSYTEYKLIKESNISIYNDIFKDHKSDFNSLVTRIEFKEEKTGPKYNIPVISDMFIKTSIDLKDRELFKKSMISTGYYNKEVFVFFNYKGKPIINILKTYNDYYNSTSKTCITTPKDFALFTMVGFKNDISKAINFFNKRFLSALKLEINEESDLISETKKILENSNIDNLIESNDLYVIMNKDSSSFDELSYIKERKPNPKSNKEVNINTKINTFLKGVKKMIESEIEIFNTKNKEYLNKFDIKSNNIFVYGFPKKSNPIRITVGLHRETFTDYNIKIKSKEFLSLYSNIIETISNIENTLDYFKEEKYDNESSATDLNNYIIDITKINMKDNSKEMSKINSYSSVSKYNLF